MECLTIKNLRILSVNEKPAQVIIVEGENQADIWWQNTPEEWSICLDLIDSLMESKKGGHQYLTDGVADDACVELSFGERSYPL